MSDMKKAEKEKTPAVSSFPYTVPLKFKNTDRTYSFGTNDDSLQAGEWVVVETAQGMELDNVSIMPSPSVFFMRMSR